ncbi:unnamed protein product [Didymodactylos carnosus]|uniref:Uncharacterized protein n=1 Tax=Didymodactylos carnosus TaxID=1234261 RepID=A0A8S2FXS2_9BILA|nr:unnamed protein product [Didymodactylos carnosus]CAF4385915.1 unnamed protein product [Didymodactylos carnosus]
MSPVFNPTVRNHPKYRDRISQVSMTNNQIRTLINIYPQHSIMLPQFHRMLPINVPLSEQSLPKFCSSLELRQAMKTACQQQQQQTITPMSEATATAAFYQFYYPQLVASLSSSNFNTQRVQRQLTNTSVINNNCSSVGTDFTSSNKPPSTMNSISSSDNTLSLKRLYNGEQKGVNFFLYLYKCYIN